MTIDPTTLHASRRGHRFGRRFRLTRSRTIVLASATGVLIQVAGVPVPPADAATGVVSYTYDAAGRLATVTTAAGTATYHYDAEGNLLSISSPVARPAHPAAVRHAPAPAPAITSAGPSVVKPGKLITITGHGFSAAAANDDVRIGTLVAPVTAASATRLTVTAPPGTGGTIRVTTPGGTARGPDVAIPEPHAAALPVAGRDANPRRAAAGVTALSGLVEDDNGNALAGIRITVASVSGQRQAAAVTGADGQFLVSDLASGQHQLIISGTGVKGLPNYGVYAEPVELPAGKTTVLPWVTYLTPLDRGTAISSPAAHEITLTTPKIPGLEIQIPKGTVIRDRAGHVVTKLSITPLTVGRTAYPLAPGMQPGFFTLQPGVATVSGPGLRVIYPNGTGQPPGTAIPYFIDTPNWPGTGWWRYGTGHVSATGGQIIPAAGARWHIISLGGYGTNPPPPNGPPPCSGGGGGGGGGAGGGGGGGPSCPAGGGGGDPVDLSSGLFVYNATDLRLHDIEGIDLIRTFRQLDNTVRDFGIGFSDSLNLYIVADGRGNFDLYLPNGGKVVYSPTGTTGLYDAVSTPTGFAGSTLSWSGGDPFGPFTVTLSNGDVLSFSNPAYLTKIADRLGNAITINRNEFTFNGGQINSVTTPNGLWMKFTYGNCVTSSPSTTCVTQVADNSGRTLNYSYDANGRLTSVADPAGGTTTYTWAACTNSTTCTELLTVTDPDGHVLTNTYDPATGRVTGQTDGAGNVWSFSYVTNSSGQITQTTQTDPRGTLDQYNYNSAGYPSSITYGAGSSSPQTVTTNFDPTTNLLTSETDALGRTTSYTYDGLGNVTSVTTQAGTASAATSTFTYDPKYSRMTSMTDSLGNTTTIAYNDAAQTETVTDALGNTWVATLNNEGQPIQITNPAGQSTYLSYLYGDLIAIANPLDQATGAYYDSLGQLTDLTDAAGNTTSYTYSPLGEMASQTDPLGGVTTYGHDADGNLTSVTDANGHTTSYTYNGDSEVSKKTDPLGNATTYSYDGDGNLTQLADAAGNTNTFAHDVFGNVTTARYGVSGTSQQTKIVYTYDAGNRMTKAVQTPGGTYQLSYNGLNNILSQTSPAGTITRTFNSFGSPTSMTVPGQTKISYTYDKDERLTKITQGTTSVSQTWDSLSRLSSVTLPDGIKGTNTYDAANELTAQTYKNGTTTVGALNYTYTPDNQIASESGSLASASLPAAVTSNTYNADNELTNANGTAYTYNKDGDLTSNGTNTYTWNAQNQLTGISGGVTAAFTYNPFGQQASATAGSSATSYLYDGINPDSNVVQELSGTTPTANLLTGPQAGQIYQFTTPGGTNSSLLQSPLGSTIALASSAGAITTSYTYSPAGAVTASGATSPSTFEYDATQNTGTGLYLMGARYYNPATGSFISQDPIGFAGGTTNLYQFVNNDPVDLNDPTGCLDCSGSHPSAWGAIIGVGIVLAVIAVVAVAPWFAAFGLEAISVAWSVASAALATGGTVVASLAAGAAGTYIGSCFGLP